MADPGQLVTVTVSATDNVGVIALALTIDGTPVPLVGGQATFSSPTPGAFAVVATADDAAGNEGSATGEIRVRDPGDTSPPVVNVTAPPADSEVETPVPVLGTATDANLVRYQLALAPVGETAFVTFFTGTEPVVAGLLGELDPGRFPNGLYTLRLLAEDVNGRTATATAGPYFVGGVAKAGLFQAAFLDLNVPVVGISVGVVRSYDSRVKSGSDFGIGWALEIARGSYENNRPPGDGWKVNPGPFGIPCTGGSSELAYHRTEIRLSDTEYYRFRPRLVNVSPDIGGCIGTVRFDYVEGSGDPATLEILANDQVVWLEYTTELLDSATFDVFEPRAVRLRTRDDRVVDLDRLDGGITRIQGPNGNGLTIGVGGITHSSGTSIAFTRDAQGRITRVTDPMGRQLRYDYDAAGDLVAFADRAGNVSTYDYDDQHNLLSINDPLGNRIVRPEYDASGRLIALVDALGERTTFVQDVPAREETVTDRRGNPERVVYDDYGYVVRRERTVTIEGAPVVAVSTFVPDQYGNDLTAVDPDGVRVDATWDVSRPTQQVVDPGGLNLTTTFGYNAKGDLASITNPAGDTQTFEVDAAGNPTRFVDEAGDEATFAYDARGLPTRLEDPLGTVRTNAYDASGRMISVEIRTPGGTLLRRTEFTYDANGNPLTATLLRTVDGVVTPVTTTVAYDANNRPVKTTNALGGEERTEYDAAGRVAARIDALGRRTTYAYDGNGNLLRTTFPDGTTEAVEYDAEGNAVGQTNRAGKRSSAAYDERGLATRLTAPDGSVTEMVYSAGGRPTAVIDARGNRTDLQHDAAGRQIGSLEPPVVDARTGTTVRPERTVERDVMGRVSAVVDANGHRVELGYDALGRVTSVTADTGAVVARTWDARGRVTSETDEDGNQTTYAWDGLDRLVAVTQPPPAPGEPAPVTTYAWDEANNLIAVTDALGHTTTFRYDLLDRLVERTRPGGGTETLTYDAVGNVLTRTEPNGATTTYEYDVMDRLVQKTLPGGDVVSYTWTALGDLDTATDARGTTFYFYDDRGRLTGVTHPDGTSVVAAWDATGNLVSLVSPAGTVTYEYDAVGRLTRASTPQGDTTFAYDPNGNRLRTTAPNGVVTEQTYDTRNRLTRVEHRTGGGATLASFAYELSARGLRTRVTEQDGSVEQYGYDALGRLVSEVRTGSAPRDVEYEYDAVGNRTRMVRDGVPTDYAYDADDRLLAAGGTTWTWDANGNVTSRLAGAALTTYGWTPENRLASVTHGGSTTTWAYDHAGNRVERAGPGGVTRYLVDPRTPGGLPQVLEERDGAGALEAFHAWAEGLLSSEHAGVARFAHADALGSTRLLSDAAGSVTDRYAYEAFGALAASSGGSENPYRFAGERLDPATGFYHLRARDYDPAIGRFTAADPATGQLHRPASLHDYLYADASPVTFTDPTGRSTLIEVSFVQAMQSFIDKHLQLKVVQAGCRAREGVIVVAQMMTWTKVAAGVIGTLGAIANQNLRLGWVAFSVDKDPPLLMLSKPWAWKKIELRAFFGPKNPAGLFTVAVDLKNDVKIRLNIDLGDFERIAKGEPLKSSLSAGFNLRLEEIKDCLGIFTVFKAEIAFRPFKFRDTRPEPGADRGGIVGIVEKVVPLSFGFDITYLHFGKVQIPILDLVPTIAGFFKPPTKPQQSTGPDA